LAHGPVRAAEGPISPTTTVLVAVDGVSHNTSADRRIDNEEVHAPTFFEHSHHTDEHHSDCQCTGRSNFLSGRWQAVGSDDNELGLGESTQAACDLSPLLVCLNQHRTSSLRILNTALSARQAAPIDATVCRLLI
jgi:hypothetical protein